MEDNARSGISFMSVIRETVEETCRLVKGNHQRMIQNIAGTTQEQSSRPNGRAQSKTDEKHDIKPQLN